MTHLKEADNTKPQVEGDDNLDEGDEEEKDADHLDSDQPQTQAHPSQVSEEEAKRADDPGEHEPPLALGSAVDHEETDHGKDGQQDQGDDEEDVHDGGEPHHLVVVLRREVGTVAVVQGLVDSAPERDRVKARSTGTGGGRRRVRGVLLNEVRHHLGHEDSVHEKDGHGDEREDGEGQGHDAHHDAADAEVHAAATPAETRHLARRAEFGWYRPRSIDRSILFPVFLSPRNIC